MQKDACKNLEVIQDYGKLEWKLGLAIWHINRGQRPNKSLQFYPFFNFLIF